ncbi:MAG: DUF362 domain-containing protein [Anaerolineae bacterium]|nr:DUF362 domain-containing protein [Anaerolineae bacterium]
MTTDHDDNRQPSKSIPRRDFLKLSAAAAAAGLLAGCNPGERPATSPMPSDAPVPTLEPTTEIDRADIIKFYPDTPKSKVVHTHHAGVWKGTPQISAGDNDLLAPEALREMLDVSIAKLTGLDDAAQAWAALFSPDERIAIKVSLWHPINCTHIPLVMAVTERLQEIGVPAEQIFIYDLTTAFLEDAGYPINRDGPGVRCYGSAPDWEEEGYDWERDGEYTPGWTLLGEDISFSNILLNSDALINIPILKTHGIGGLTFALKSHYGSFNRASDFHQDNVEHNIVRAIPALNALPPIKDRSRLIIGDALTVGCLRGRQPWPDWDLAVTGDSILMGFDPVAMDRVGLEYACRLAEENGERTINERWTAETWLKGSAELGLGTDDPENIDLVKVNLG